MKILPLVKGIQNDITSSTVLLKRATNDGYSIADRTSRIYKQGKLTKYFNVTRCVTDKVVHGTTARELPYIGAAIGLFSPIPFMFVAMFFLGLFVQIPLKIANILSNKINKSHNIDNIK